MDPGAVSWRGEFHFGPYRAAFRGQPDDNSPHAHAALQLCVSPQVPVRVYGGGGVATEARTLLIRPDVTHRLDASERLLLLFVEPQARVAQGLLSDMAGDIGRLPDAVANRLALEGPLTDVLKGLLGHYAVPIEPVDERLIRALAHLSTDSSGRDVSVGAAAKRVGLSAPRLRALASEQLGVPLTRLAAWRQLRGATEALATGASLAEAAYASGYADQAHFSRSMRKILGITPKQARGIPG